MKFYINEINQSFNGKQSLKDDEKYVGLFSECETKGEGYFGGYYSCEKYMNTYLIAYSVFKGEYLAERVSDITLINKHFDSIQIRTHMWTKVIEAPSIKQAIEKFKNSDWRQWSNDLDGKISNANTI